MFRNRALISRWRVFSNRSNRCVLGEIVLQQSGPIKLSEQLYDGFLAGGFVRELFQTFLPNCFDRSVGAQPGDEFVGGGLQPKELIAERVFQDMPAPAAKVLPAHANAGAKADSLIGDPVPRLAEGGGEFAILPPQKHSQEIDPMGEDPKEGAFFHGSLQTPPPDAHGPGPGQRNGRETHFPVLRNAASSIRVIRTELSLGWVTNAI